MKISVLTSWRRLAKEKSTLDLKTGPANPLLDSRFISVFCYVFHISSLWNVGKVFFLYVLIVLFVRIIFSHREPYFMFCFISYFPAMFTKREILCQSHSQDFSHTLRFIIRFTWLLQWNVRHCFCFQSLTQRIFAKLDSNSLAPLPILNIFYVNLLDPLNILSKNLPSRQKIEINYLSFDWSHNIIKGAKGDPQRSSGVPAL
jgi:hypothetical protein